MNRDASRAAALQQARARFSSALEGARNGDVASVAALLEAAGTLRLAGAEQETQQAATEARGLLFAIARCLREADFASLEGAAIRVCEAATEVVTAEGPELDRLRSEVLEALATRDRFELLMQGATALLGVPPKLSEDQESYLLEFASLVRPELWRLVPLNEDRLARCEWVDRGKMESVWWWSHGRDIPSSGLDALGTAAHLLVRYPEAREHLERLVRAQHVMDGHPERAIVRETAPTDEVIVLADWVRDRGRAPDWKLAVGYDAQSTDEPSRRPLVRAPLCSMDWVEPDTMELTLDPSLQLSCPPELITPQGPTSFAPVSGQAGQYRLQVRAEALHEPSAVLRLSHDGEVLELFLGSTDDTGLDIS